MPRCLIAILLLGAVIAGEPVFLDLTPSANTAWRDDGIPDNGVGGWTDEGINDMGIFPAAAPGVQEVNGVRFRLPEAAAGGPAVVMLRGARLAAKPPSVTVAAGGATGRFIYVIHHGVARPDGVAKEEVVATYTLTYADGSSASLPIRDGRELRHWWTGAWWDNNGAEAWPVLMGQNTYTAKWNKWIGLWATRWTNPSPEKPIASLTLASAGRVAIAVWAITIDDRDHQQVLGPDYKLTRPDAPPAGFFEPALALERRQIGAAMRGLGMLRGVRELRTVRPDLLELTIDAAVAGGPGMGEAEAAALQRSEAFTLRIAGAESRPQQVGRHSFLYTTADIGRFPVNPIHWHTYYLRLAAPLVAGQLCTVRVAGLAGEGVVSEATLAFDPATSITPAIKVNQAAYAAGAGRRYAYLGWWAGDLGAVSFADCSAFEVVSETDGAVALRGAVTVRAATEDGKNKPVDGIDPLSGEAVREIDLALLGPGRYHLRLPGIGRSWSFAVGGEAAWQVARISIRGLLTQRCGCDLAPAVTAFPRPACHVQTWEHGHLLGGLHERREDGKLVIVNPPRAPGEAARSFHGGYHDAADYDLFAGHLFGAARLLDAFEAALQAWKDGDLGLPESGNGIPDLLDEVAWGLRFYAENQGEDGAVPAGRGNDEDYQNKEWLKDGAKEHGQIPPFGVLPPNRSSTATFAAVAAQYARLIAPFDRAQGEVMRGRAERAWTWAAQDGGGAYRNGGTTYAALSWPRALFWGAAELWETTGDKRYLEHVLAHRSDAAVWKHNWNEAAAMPFFRWAVARGVRPGTDEAFRGEQRAAILASADGAVKAVDRTSYRMGARPDGAGGWGDMTGGAEHGMVCLLAWRLTGEAKYLDAASLNADYQLGCNPLGRSFITGLGSRPPLHPVLRPWLIDAAGIPVPGVPVYGPGGGANSLRGCHPEAVPSWRCWLDNPTSELHSEFDVVRMQKSAGFFALLWTAGLQRP